MQTAIPKPKNFEGNVFPWWVVKPEGKPLLIDNEFNGLTHKYGASISGAGSLNRDTNNFFSGVASLQMVTGAVGGNTTTGKIATKHWLGLGKYAFELKYIPDVTDVANMAICGIEARFPDNVFNARLRVLASGELEYFTGTGVNTKFSDGGLFVQIPTEGAGAGDEWGWARLVVDTKLKEYVSAETINSDGLYEKRDMTGIPMADFGTPNRDQLVFYCYQTTNNASAKTGLTTDWCISKL